MSTHIKTTVIPNIWLFFFVRLPQLERRARVVVSLSRAWQPVSKGNKGEGSTGPMKG